MKRVAAVICLKAFVAWRNRERRNKATAFGNVAGLAFTETTGMHPAKINCDNWPDFQVCLERLTDYIQQDYNFFPKLEYAEKHNSFIKYNYVYLF